MRRQNAGSEWRLSGDTHKLFSIQTLILCIVGLIINIVFANLIIELGLPMYVDNVGSVLVGALAGPIPGMMVGFLSNAMNAVGSPITLYYGILTVIMAGLASAYAVKGYFYKWYKVVFIIISFIFIGGAIGSVMTWFLYGGGIGGIGASLAYQIQNSIGAPDFCAQFSADILIDIPDKTITVLLVCLFLRILPDRVKEIFPLGVYHVKHPEQINSEIEAESAMKPKKSIKTLILKMILLCSILISVATTLISFSMYCEVTSDFNERLEYFIQLVSVSFAISLLICAVTIWIASEKIVEPINQIMKQSRAFQAMPSEKWLKSKIWTERVPIHSGDEIEALYHTICAEQETVAHNVAQMKENEEQLRHSKELEDALVNARLASQAKGQFLSRMSHEIRTPLNAVIGYMDIAKDSVDRPDKMMHCVENSDLAARHLLNIINDILDISSIESGKMKIAHEEFDMSKQITTVSTIFFHQAKEKGIDFQTKIHELSHEWLVGDSLRINQILMNLLSNAMKFTPAGGQVSLTITQMRDCEQEIFLKFEISDTGIGMSEEYQKKLFTPFEQESASTAQKYGGTGLGLSITGNLVSMMGGAIEVHSKKGEGSTFIVTLPLEKSIIIHDKSEKHKDYSHVRVLVVDDEKDSCDYVKTLLKRCGVKSDIATSGEEAIQQVKRRMGGDYAYNLCILDWNMPGMDGIETAKRIRQECEQEMPVIIATAYDVTDIEDDAKAAGVNKVISKPLFQSTLFDLLVSNYGKYEPAHAIQGVRFDLTGMHLLLAEDNMMNREIAEEILKKAGIQVDSVADGQEAVECFEKSAEGTYQAILMDIQMPVLDGYGATRKIRKLDHPQAKKIPIVAMTANAFNEDVAAALASGMNDHISKPVDYDKLFHVLNKIMVDYS